MADYLELWLQFNRLGVLRVAERSLTSRRDTIVPKTPARPPYWNCPPERSCHIQIAEKAVTFGELVGIPSLMTVFGHTESEQRGDADLLGSYVDRGSEEAFSAIVAKYINLVYSVALRVVRDPQLAQDVTQTVFIILARKARKLRTHSNLAGWLCRTARYAASKASTSQFRQMVRDQEAYMQSTQLDPVSTNDMWEEIEPNLEAAMSKLSEKDQNAVIQRYFLGYNFNAIAAAAGTTEAAAKMRVGRAIEKLRLVLGSRGVKITSSILTSAIAANSLQAAPAGCAVSVASAAVNGVASNSTWILVESTGRHLAVIKAKSLAIFGAITIVLVTVPILAIHTVQKSLQLKVDYTSPEATLQTMIAALRRADTDAFANTCTPARAAQFNAQNALKTGEVLKKEAALLADMFSSVRVNRRQFISPEEIHLWVRPAVGTEWPASEKVMIFKRIGLDWKFDGNRN